MKTVRLIDQGEAPNRFEAKAILRAVLGQAAVTGGVKIEEMRQRVNILNDLDKAKDTLAIEDAPFAFMKQTIVAFPFGVAHPDLLAVLDALTTPVEDKPADPEPPAPKKGKS